jgi:hypothetical protein
VSSQPEDDSDNVVAFDVMTDIYVRLLRTVSAWQTMRQLAGNKRHFVARLSLRTWLTSCSIRDVSFATFVDRARADFVEMPGLELTLPQAVRLWNLGIDDCRRVLDALADVGFLKWTHRRTVIRTGQAPPVGFERQLAYVPVRMPIGGDKSVP